ncbi:MAG: DUF5678 domain-containing protein [Planctomycetota bacterium]|nr:DUF5678 domain-containing protein [Planctomycetota bacterium]
MKLEYQLNEDDVWIREHFEELVEKYEGKYVAVVDEKIAGVADTRIEAENMALKQNPDKLPSVIIIPHKEDFECLL